MAEGMGPTWRNGNIPVSSLCPLILMKYLWMTQSRLNPATIGGFGTQFAKASHCTAAEQEAGRIALHEGRGSPF